MQAQLVLDARPGRAGPSVTERDGFTLVELAKDVTSVILEGCLVVLLRLLHGVRICRVHKVDRVKIHNLVREAVQLFYQVLLAVLVGLPSVVGATRLQVHHLYKQHQYMLELLRYDVSDVEHVLEVDLIELKLEHSFDVAAVCLSVHHVDDGSEALCGTSRLLRARDGRMLAHGPLDAVVDLCLDRVVHYPLELGVLLV